MDDKVVLSDSELFALVGRQQVELMGLRGKILSHVCEHVCCDVDCDKPREVKE